MLRVSLSAIVLVATVTGCDFVEVTDTSYPDMSAAVSRGGVSSGWVPRWIPASATDLREVHNIDTNESALAFEVSSADPWPLPDNCIGIKSADAIPSHFKREWWPDATELKKHFSLYRCHSDVALNSVFVGVHSSGQRGLHWRVGAR